jgi:hypothetical protein
VFLDGDNGSVRIEWSVSIHMDLYPLVLPFHVLFQLRQQTGCCKQSANVTTDSWHLSY